MCSGNNGQQERISSTGTKSRRKRIMNIPCDHLLVLAMGAIYFSGETAWYTRKELVESKCGLEKSISIENLQLFSRELSRELHKMGLWRIDVDFPTPDNKEDWSSIFELVDGSFICHDENMKMLYDYYIGLHNSYPIPLVRNVVRKMKQAK